MYAAHVTPPHWIGAFNAEQPRAGSFRSGLAGGNRLRPRVVYDHRAAERHAPEAFALPFADCLDVLEGLLRALLIDLRRRRQRVNRHDAQENGHTARSRPT